MPADLLYRDNHSLRLLAFYYDELNNNADLRAALQKLSDHLPSDLPHGLDIGELPSGLRTPIERFVADWPLPGECGAWYLRGSHHVHMSLYMERLGMPLRLSAGELSYSEVFMGGVIWPPRLPPVAYDPLERASGAVPVNLDTSEICWEPGQPFVRIVSDIKDYASKAAREVRASIIAQAKALEAKPKGQGWSTTGLGSKEPQALARRLYARTVKKRSWQQIADTEHVERQTVRDGVEAAAALLDIPLPRRSPGRPRTRQ